MMYVEWDPGKAADNRRKHRVHFAEAANVLLDPRAMTQEDPLAQGEQRFVTVGMDLLGRILTVAYTYRGERPRLISARRATRKERQQYEHQ
jgi:uncharacterized protein